MTLQKNKSLIDALNACIVECNHCITACLGEQHIDMLKKCISLDMDCASICQLTVTLIARGSEHGGHLLKECIEVCESCAKECEKHNSMDHCKVCAEACRRCAEVCRVALG